MATRNGNLETYTDSNIVSPYNPASSAYFDSVTVSAGAYGAGAAADYAELVYTVNAIVAALNARGITKDA
jgi:hypothetical protein